MAHGMTGIQASFSHSTQRFRINSYGLQALLIAAVAGSVATSAYAQWTFDPKSLAMLPPYCKHAQLYRDAIPGGNDPAEIKRWSSRMGTHNFIHVHHYCRGLEHTNTALYLVRTKAQRDVHLGYSIGEFNYVIANVAPDFVLLPELFTKKGENLIRLGRAPEGVMELKRATELKADYWPPYAALSDHYKSTGDVTVARDWLEKGLRAAPGTQALQRRLAEIGSGKR